MIGILPLLDIPVTSFGSSTDDMAALQNLRKTAKRTDGFFLIRREHVKSVGATVPLYGAVDVSGRWHIAKICWSPVVPDMYEIYVRRTNSCYYGACFGKEELEANIGFLMQEADAAIEEDTIHGSERPKDAFWDVVTGEDPFAAFGFEPVNPTPAA